MATKNTQLVPKNLENKILEKTPKAFVMQRVGRGGGKPLSYVETGYVIARLNEIFNYNWDFKIIEEKLGKKHLVVRGELVGKVLNPITGNFETITKTQYGGAEIKIMRATGEQVDPADDLKAAASDCLKKCASMFGIAQDIFWPHGNEYQHEASEDEQPPQMPEQLDNSKITASQMQTLLGLLPKKGKTVLDLHTYVKTKYNVNKLNELTYEQAVQVLEKVTETPDIEQESVEIIDEDEDFSNIPL